MRKILLFILITASINTFAQSASFSSGSGNFTISFPNGKAYNHSCESGFTHAVPFAKGGTWAIYLLYIQEKRNEHDNNINAVYQKFTNDGDDIQLPNLRLIQIGVILNHIVALLCLKLFICKKKWQRLQR